jgi:hypothetical protein
VRDQRVQPVRLDPHACGLALAAWAAPLGGLVLGVGSRECPRPVITRRRQVLAVLDRGELRAVILGVVLAELRQLVRAAHHRNRRYGLAGCWAWPGWPTPLHRSERIDPRIPLHTKDPAPRLAGGGSGVRLGAVRRRCLRSRAGPSTG